MKYELYVIFDRVAGMYMAPSPQVNQAAAIRWFNDIISQDKHGEDYELYYLGTYDSHIAEIIYSKPTFIARFEPQAV